MTAKPQLIARRIVDLAPSLDAGRPVDAFGVGIDGSVCAVQHATAEDRRFEDEAGASFAKSRLDGAAPYRLARWRDGELSASTLEVGDISCHHVQPAGDGVLLVGARCRWRPEAVELNAVLHDAQGRVVRRFTLGDGIQDVRVGADGSILVSYFDEGVFGNCGWGGPGPEPIGSAGLVTFDQEGQRLWSFDADEAGTDAICDAHAANLAPAGDAWVYFYTEFPIVRCSKAGYTAWETETAGARAMAVRDDRVLLFGGYDVRDRGLVLRLGREGRARFESEAQVVGPDGQDLGALSAVGVGETLYFLDGLQVLALDRW